MPITHSKVDSSQDSSDTSLVRPSDWNANHTGTAPPDVHAHPESDVTNLVADLSGKVGTGDIRLSDARTPLTHGHTEADVVNLVTDLAAKETPAGAQAKVTTHEGAADPHTGYTLETDPRLSDARIPVSHGDSLHGVDVASLAAGKVPTAELGGAGASGANFLRGDQTWAVPGSGSDPWTYVVLAADFNTTSATAVDVTGLAFTPLANLRYEFEAKLMTRTATATVGPRPGLAWPTGMTDGVVGIRQPSSATAFLTAFGNISAAVLAAIGGVPTTTGSWLAKITGMAVAGATPSGTVKVQLASETAGTAVTIKAGSFLRYRTY